MRRLADRLLALTVPRLLLANIALAVLVKVLLPLGAGSLAAIGLAPSTVDPVSVMVATNDARHTAGLAPLTHNSVLDVAAQARIEDMAQRNYFGHQNPDGRMPWDFISAAGYRYQTAGENLARGFYDATVLVNAWLGSPTHRANVLNINYRDIGVATQRIMLNGVPSMVVVELYGALRTTAAAAPALPAVIPGGQRVSTDNSIQPVTVVLSATNRTAAIASVASTYLALWLSIVVAALTFAGVWVRDHRKLAVAWGAHLALLVVVVVAPTIASTAHIF